MSGANDLDTTWWGQARTLLQRYAALVGVGVTFLLFAFIVVPALLRERRPPPQPPSDQPAAASAGWLHPADAPASRGKELPPIDPATVMTPNPKLLARGETLYKQQCASCHGDRGKGDGPAASSLKPAPRDFSQANGWTRGYHVPEVFATITDGIKGTGMAAFDFILPADRMALVHYVRGLGSFDHGADDPQKMEALANQFRSTGVRIPNRIPVSLAVRKMAKEQPAVLALRLPEPTDRSESAELVRGVIADPAAAARTVAHAGKRADRDALVRAWVAGAPHNGFSPLLATLDAEQWQMVTTALLGDETAAAAYDQEESAALPAAGGAAPTPPAPAANPHEKSKGP